MKDLNILFTTAHFPYPLIGGDRIKPYYILKYLAEKNNVFVVGFNRKYPVKTEYIEHFLRIGIKAVYVDLNLTKAYLNGAIYSPFGNSLEIEFFRDKKFARIVNEIYKDKKIDLVINYFLRTTEYVRNFKCKKYLLAEDCRSYYQKRTYNETKNIYEKAIRLYESKKLIKYESEITNDFDLTTLVSEDDRNEMQKLNPEANIKILSNGVDTDRFKLNDDNIKRNDIVFVGKLDIWVNNLMIERIVKGIYPKILKVLPNTKLHIVGANPQKWHYKLQSDKIVLHTNVPDIVPYLQRASVFIHPHLGGSGIQNKVLEAMACGCPVITTKSGARGINISSGENGFVLESDEAIAYKAIELLENESLVEYIGQNAREYILKHHKWEYIYEQLDELLEELMK